jgi:hypothetical protein
MERLDQGHLHPLLEQLRHRTRVSAVGVRALYSKELIKQLCCSYSEPIQYSIIKK